MAAVRRRAKAAGRRVQRFTAWSYSRLQSYDECPLKARLKFIDKLEEGPPGKALLRGTKIHEEAEAYLNAKRAPKKFPATLEIFAAEFKMLRKLRAIAEGESAFTADWEPTGWFDSDTWCRVKTDANYMSNDNVYVVIDFKTGQLRQWHENQLELYGLAGLIENPDADSVRAELWYLDHGDIVEMEYTHEQKDELIDKWSGKVKKMMADGLFKPTPSNNSCQWCNFKKAKGGPCEF